MEVIEGHLYDYPKYYDLVYGSDWKSEFDFLEDCFERFTERTVRRLFEPACGTGRLLIKFAQAGYQVAGNDLNAHAVRFCNDRLVRFGYEPTAFVGDMADFRLKRKVDAAFNMINSFRHLPTESAAESHLKCVAASLASGGLYVLGLHLTPTVGDRVEMEAWSARRGNLAVCSTLWSEELDLKNRVERVGMKFDVFTPTRQFQIAEELNYRTYTKTQFERLLRRVEPFECVAIYDFSYEIDFPNTLNSSTEDVVFVLRKTT